MASQPGGSRRLVVIPTYNEAANLELIVDRVRASVPSVDVLVVDDGSPDGTGEIADKIAAHDGQVNVIHRTEKAGLGAAYLAGFDWGMSRGYEVLIEMDADGSHLPEQLPRLLDALPDADLVIGSRWVPGGRVVNWPRRRKALSRGGNVYVRLALGIPVRDATAGYRAIKRHTLERLDLGSVESQGYCFQVDLTRRALARGLRVLEVPITFVERENGVSKMSGAIVREALWRVTIWGFARRIGQVLSLVGLARKQGGRRLDASSPRPDGRIRDRSHASSETAVPRGGHRGAGVPGDAGVVGDGGVPGQSSRER